MDSGRAEVRSARYLLAESSCLGDVPPDRLGNAFYLTEKTRNKMASWLGLVGLLCPACLLAIILLMRHGLYTFADDFHGYKGLGYFLLWASALLPAGALCSSAGVVLNHRNLLPILGLLVNFGLMLFGIVSL